MTKTITEAQRRVFWRLFAASTSAQGLDRPSAEAYRKKVMLEEAGVQHLADIGRTDGFDAVCLRLAIDGDLTSAAIHYSASADRRIRALVDQTAAKIAPGRESAYVNACARRAGLILDGQDWREDLVTSDLVILLKILKTYSNRHNQK